MTIFFGPDPVTEAIQNALSILDGGGTVTESRCLDLKEEAGRRHRDGSLGDARTENLAAAQQIAREAACMANTPGGGALLIGVSDDSTLIGTQLDAEWLRHRIYEITQRQLTLDVRAATVGGVRILVARSPEAIEPIRVDNRITWRVNDHCVEVDASTWHERRHLQTGYDWSAQPSTLSLEQVSPTALEVTRRFLTTSGEPRARDLAQVSDHDLLTRIGAIAPGGFLTKAAVILFTASDGHTLDYVHRNYHGGDSTERSTPDGVALVEALQEVFRSFSAHNPLVHLGASALTRGQVRVIPERAAREAIVNAVAHRDWSSPEPTTIEHVGRSLTVTSPGGFYGGVNPENVITHPSRSRNKSLINLLRALRVAEAEGIGVDRMYVDMLSSGNRSPSLRELPDPAVQVSLSAEVTDPAWPLWLDRIDTPQAHDDVRWLITLDSLKQNGWVDINVLTRLLQTSTADAESTVAQLWQATMDGQPLLTQVDGVPSSYPPAWTLSPTARRALELLDLDSAFRRIPLDPQEVALGYVRHRGRISSTELASITATQAPNMSGILKRMEEDGTLRPSRPNRRGRGFFYLPAAENEDPDDDTGRGKL